MLFFPRRRLIDKFALPLKGMVGGADHQDPLDEAPQLEFADQQARHDRFSRAGVVGEQEAHAGQLQEVLVDGLKLVRQRVHPRDGKAEIGIELVGDTQPVGLQGRPQQPAIAILGEDGIDNGQVGQFI